jgi:hypothetical protein
MSQSIVSQIDRQRYRRALALAENGHVTRSDFIHYAVLSATGSQSYHVRLLASEPIGDCDCPDGQRFALSNGPGHGQCKHVLAACIWRIAQTTFARLCQQHHIDVDTGLSRLAAQLEHYAAQPQHNTDLLQRLAILFLAGQSLASSPPEVLKHLPAVVHQEAR